MKSITSTNLRNRMTETMEEVCKAHAPVVITGRNRSSVVLLSLADYEALEETAYLMKTPANAMRLMESVAEIESGHGREKALAE